jgi:hypothetical protein
VKTWRNLENNALSSLHKLLRNRLVGGGGGGPKARGLAQHGGPPGRLEESDPAGVTLYMMDGPYRLPFLYSTVLP